MKIVSIPPGDLGLCGFSFVHYSKKCFTQIYRALYGDAILVLMQMGGHQHGWAHTSWGRLQRVRTPP